MEKKQAQATNGCSYEDFQPSSKWVREESQDKLVVSVPEFKKDQLRVQVDTKGNMKISGKRPLEENKYSRFEQDFRIPDNQNFKMDVVHAKLVDGQLYVTIPKKITEPKDPATPTPQSLPAKKVNESKMKPKNTQEEANGGVIKGAPSHQLLQPPQQLQPQMENQKSDLTAGDGTVAGSTETNSGGRMVAAVPPEKENIPAAGKRKQEGGFEFGMGGMVSRLKKRRLVVVNVALAILVVALGVYVTYKLRSGEESHEN